MNKLFNNIAKLCCAVLVAMPFVACQEDEPSMSDALMVSSTSIIVPAAENDKTITIYADNSWVADVSEDWLSLDKSSGKGTVDVTVHFDYNSAAEPRTAHLYVQGASHLAIIDVEITQKGDRYKDAVEYSVSELAALEVGTLVRVKESQVAGFTKSGFVVVDGESAIYVSGSTSFLKAGDKVTMTGEIVSLNGITALQLEDPTVTGAGELVLPEAVNLTEGLSSFVGSLPSSPKHVSFHGSYSGSSFSIGDDEIGKAVDPLDALLLNNLALHYLSVEAWYIGQSNGKLALLVLSAEDEGFVGTIYLGFEIETSAFESANKDTFSTTSQFAANTGTGYIQYVPYDLEGTNGNNKFALDISGKDPRCTGPWPEDYWLFYGDSPIKSGSKVEIKFGCRTSGTGHKYWILEYLDGKTWKTAGAPLVSDDIPESAGGNVIYTHAMNSDGATNVIVDETVVFERNVEHGQFRFRCVANWQANGNGTLAARNGGTARLAVSSANAVASQPTIIILEEGDGSAADPVEANISASVDYLAFDGIPAESKTFTVNSDYDYTLTSGASWLHLDVESGAAGQEQTVTVTCDNTTLSSIRETVITILSNETVKTIPVVQGAAGQDLEPFVSIVGSNSVTVLGQGGSFDVKVQANVDFETEIKDSWITEVEVPATRAMVETTEKSFKAAPNLTGADRVGTVRFFKGNIESVLTVTQEKFEPAIKVTTTVSSLGISGLGGVANYTIDSNVPFTVSADSWIKLPVTSAEAGENTVPVTFEANLGESRTGSVTFRNEEYDYTYVYTVKQFADGTYFFDDFSWLKPMIDKYNAANGTPIGNPVTGYTEEEYASASSANAPNIYSTKPFMTEFPDAFAAAGYVDLNQTGKVIYPQDTYLKFGRTSVHTSLQLPAIESLDGTADVIIDFDWCAHIQGTGTVDPVTLTIVITGEGTFENGTKYSEPLENTQQAKQMFWTHASVKAKGINKDTRFNIVYTNSLNKETGKYNWTVSGAHRYHLDNIRISK